MPNRQERQSVKLTTPHSSSAPTREASSRQSKVAIVTGASSGIGLEAVKRLAALTPLPYTGVHSQIEFREMPRPLSPDELLQLLFFFGGQKTNAVVILTTMRNRPCRIRTHLSILYPKAIAQRQQRTIVIEGGRSPLLFFRCSRKPVFNFLRGEFFGRMLSKPFFQACESRHIRFV